ncbi:hypothetical protein [Stutzerimonas stutzeri]|uniref:hypothetical protein n=1 Tax=Stutzerimonas stutzeri TaxID=316 RepID=UPI00210AA79A|nr:hypothetical protein [Stutzerimonas stutzeri]MCQ4257210.1 hypothetical protein [Stutzerimonas stutzeri]
MDMRVPVLVMMVAAAPLVSATGTGPTLPEKSREHPLDTREPRQDVIEDRSGSQDKPRPPTLESPTEPPAEQPSQDGDTDARSAAESPATVR